MTKNEILASTLEMVSLAMDVSEIKMKRNKYDYFADKLRQAASMSNLFDMFEKLCGLLECSVASLQYKKKDFATFCKNAREAEAVSVLHWLRKNAVLAIMACTQRKVWDETQKDGKGAFVPNDEEFFAIVNSFDIPDAQTTGRVSPMKDFDINLSVKCLSPLAHGSDVKMGNATGFRTYQVMTENDNVIDLPAYSGNALRGILRDLLADHMLESLGIKPDKTNPPVNLWFFHVLYEGGALKGVNTEIKKVTDRLGKNGNADMQGLYEFRDKFPAISLMGTAIGNRMLEGRINVSKLRPVCYEWGFDTDINAASLLTWEFLVRKNDHEDYEEHSGMIANTEVLKTGTELRGGIDVSPHANELEQSALLCGLDILVENGYIGAQNAKGLGQIDMTYKAFNVFSDSSPGFGGIYEKYLQENKDDILKYMEEIGAIN